MSQPDQTATAYKTPTHGQPIISIMGPVVQFLASPEQASDQFVVLDSILAPGIIVPLHSHPEVECLYVLEGGLQVLAFQDGKPHWLDLTVGESAVIPANARHAIRNVSGENAQLLLITAATMGKFFEEISAPLAPGKQPAPPAPETIQAFFATSMRYGYWLASPAENAAVGIVL
jgi:quercetin dioxygenase-like cupin family protein